WKWALIIWVGITWATFQHTLSGLRHFVMDVGAGYELRANRNWSVAVLALAIILTVVLWTYIYYWRLV
ncbi:MAG: succinate dehydrogenase / fumarate reductase, cytochrome b subunit, partial [Sphingomonadales bacterium]|nr:succinate dehydrogenase / fumarate reductase, cytochrome b subunit [Sphingomonadales bacterium]